MIIKTIMENYDLETFKSRKEINKLIFKLKIYYVYGTETNYEREYTFMTLYSLRNYKNTKFPKKKLF